MPVVQLTGIFLSKLMNDLAGQAAYAAGTKGEPLEPDLSMRLFSFVITGQASARSSDPLVLRWLEEKLQWITESALRLPGNDKRGGSKGSPLAPCAQHARPARSLHFKQFRWLQSPHRIAKIHAHPPSRSFELEKPLQPPAHPPSTVHASVPVEQTTRQSRGVRIFFTALEKQS